MLRRTSNILNARVDEDLRAKVERYARKHDLNLSQVVLRALEALVDEGEKKPNKPIEQTAQIPN